METEKTRPPEVEILRMGGSIVKFPPKRRRQLFRPCTFFAEAIQRSVPTNHALRHPQSETFWGTHMSDDTKQTGLDRKLISLEEDYEVRDWSKSLGCTPGELRAAVKAVGNSAEKVREYLAGKK
jgi:hypothetical protein